MAIMDRVSDLTPTGEISIVLTPASAMATPASISCSDCGLESAGPNAPMTWGFARSGTRVSHSCPECVKAALDEIETFITF